MQRILLAASLLLGIATPAIAQSQPGNPGGGDASITYEWVHVNAEPGDCGCFGLNGFGVSASWNVISRVAAVAEFSGQHATEGAPFHSSLTLVSYLAGARYYLPALPAGRVRLQPFAQVLVGTSHAGGGIAGAGDGTYSFAGRIGGGIDLPVKNGFVVRAVQLDYSSTQFANTTNAHQNNLLFATGAAFRWGQGSR